MKKVIILIVLSVLTFAHASSAQQNGLDNLPASELRELVAPIALYPDPLLGYILPASVFPAQIVDAALLIRGESDADLIARQSWEDSVKGVATYPGVLKMMYEKLDWTTKLGGAFVNQADELRDAIQSLRVKAQQYGNLQTTPEQSVSTKKVDGQSIIIIEPAKPEVIYVPQYSTTVVYSEPAPPSANYLTPLATFGLGMAFGAAISDNNNNSGNNYYYGGYPGGVSWYHHDSYDHWVDNRQDMIKDSQNHRQDVQKDRINYKQDMREDRTNFRQDQIESGNYKNKADRQQFSQEQAAKRQNYSESTKQTREARSQDIKNSAADKGYGSGNRQVNTDAAKQNREARSQQFKSTAADRGYGSGSRSTSGLSSASSNRSSAFGSYSNRSAASASSSRGSMSRGSSGFSRSGGSGGGGGGRRAGGGGGGGGRRR